MRGVLDKIFKRRQVPAAIPWKPARLFTTGVNGAWYDPSDITRYMSSLGPELVTNGDFSNGTTGWGTDPQWVISGGVATATASSAAQDLYQVSRPSTPGKTYKVSFGVIAYTSGQLKVRIGGATLQYSPSITSTGEKTYYFVADSASFTLYFEGVNGAAFTGSIDNISVRELTGISTATLFQDAAGTTPVTAVGQPVGLMLDKSKGLVLGSELVTNGDFSSGTTGWTNSSTGTGTFTVSSGAATIIGTDGSNRGAFSQNIGAVAGRFYKVSFNATITSGAGSFFGSGPGSAGGAIANGLNTYYIASASNGAFFVYTNSGGGNITIDNISVRELPGNHAYNPSGNSANFPVLSARYNLLTKTEDFSDAAWTKTRCSINANAITAPDGTLTADKLIEDSSASTTHAIQSSAQTLPLGNYTGVFYGKAAERTWAVLGIGASTTGIAYFDLLNGLVGTVTGGYTASIQSVGNGWFKCTLTGQAAATLTNPYAIYTATGNNGGSYTGDGTSGVYIWGADLRVANDALNQPAYQRVNTATDYDTVGFKPYLSFNGVNQWLQTNSIDFTYGDKMLVSAGVRVSGGGSATKTLIEQSTDSYATNNTVAIFHGFGGLENYAYRTHGSGIAVDVVASAAIPITNVLSSIGNISAPNAALRVNGVQVSQSTATQGTGNYGNYPLYLGARAGTSLWFNGRLYGLVVAGKQASASEIASTEAWLNQKTGAYEGTPGSLSLDLNFTDNTYYSRVI